MLLPLWFCFFVFRGVPPSLKMAKSKNHTAHNQSKCLESPFSCDCFLWTLPNYNRTQSWTSLQSSQQVKVYEAFCCSCLSLQFSDVWGDLFSMLTQNLIYLSSLNMHHNISENRDTAGSKWSEIPVLSFAFMLAFHFQHAMVWVKGEKFVGWKRRRITVLLCNRDRVRMSLMFCYRLLDARVGVSQLIFFTPKS